MNRLVNHMQMNNLDELDESAYKAQHSIETVLIKIRDDVGRALDQGKGVLVLFLDMSAAFDTIDPGILSDILSSNARVEGSSLSWFRSYIM